MSAHRDLVNAQQALNEAVAKWNACTIRTGYASISNDLRDAYASFTAAQQAMLDAPGAASARNTSINAAHANLPAKRSLRRDILECVHSSMELFGTGKTVAELKGQLRKEHSSVSAAINGLMVSGWLKDSGERRNTQHDKPAIVWAPTERAVEMIRNATLGAD